MDAVCFVLGVNAKELRGAQLRVSSIDSVVWRNALFADVLVRILSTAPTAGMRRAIAPP